MLEDDFLKEKQNIREKMLKYSRAISQGKPLDEEFKEEFSSDDILRRRFKNKKKNPLEPFEDFEESKDSKHSNIYLKEDLINVKLEERQSLVLKILSRLSKKREKKEKIDKKTKKFFSFKNFKKESKIPQKTSEKKAEKTFEKTAEKNLEKKPTKNLEKSEISLKQTKLDLKEKEQISSLKNLILQEKSTEKNTLKASNLKKNLESKKEPKKETQSEFKPGENFKTEPKTAQSSEDNEKTKNVLLEGFSDATKEDKNLSPNHLLFAVLLISFALFVFAPQIYIRNQIYYLSREIAALRAEESVLNEENKDLKRKLENMRFQNQILDYLE